MLTALLYIYLTGWAGTSAYTAHDMCFEPPKPKMYDTKLECTGGAVMAGSIWPWYGVLYFAFKNLH